jgi:hypothetical protein
MELNLNKKPMISASENFEFGIAAQIQTGKMPRYQCTSHSNFLQ